MINFKHYFSKTLTRQLVVGITLTHAILMTVFVLDLVDKQKHFLLKQNEEQSFGLVETLAASGKSWVIANDVIGMEEVISSQLSFPNLQYAMFIDLNNKVLSHTKQQYTGKYLVDDISAKLLKSTQQGSIVLIKNGLQIDVATPIIINKKQIGWARVGLDRTKIADNLEVVSNNGLFYMLLAIVVGAVFAYITGRGLTLAIRKMNVSAKMVGEGSRNVKFEVQRIDEIGELSRQFDKTMHTLKLREEELNHHKIHLESTVEKRTIELKSTNDALIETNLKVKDKNKKLKTALREKEQMQKQLIESEKLSSLGSLVIGVSHQINTPLGISLTAITCSEQQTQILLEQLENGTLTKSSATSALNEIKASTILTLDNIERSINIVNRFKKIANIQTTESKRSISVHDYIEETIEYLTSEIEKNNIKLHLNIDKALSLTSVPNQFALVIQNLLSNSIKHGFKGVKAGEITIEAESKKDELVISYSDNGIGMNKEQVKRLYEPFYTTEIGKGDGGLGMYCVFNIINHVFNGTIECSTSINQGVTFLIKIPLD